MVKKISGQPPKTQGAQAVQGPRTIESAKVGSIDQVKTLDKQERLEKTKSGPTQITPEMKEQLFQMIDEEAEKMFGGAFGIPKSKRDTVTGAVKMAISAGILEEDETSSTIQPKKKS